MSGCWRWWGDERQETMGKHHFDPLASFLIILSFSAVMIRYRDLFIQTDAAEKERHNGKKDTLAAVNPCTVVLKKTAVSRNTGAAGHRTRKGTFPMFIRTGRESSPGCDTVGTSTGRTHTAAHGMAYGAGGNMRSGREAQCCGQIGHGHGPGNHCLGRTLFRADV